MMAAPKKEADGEHPRSHCLVVEDRSEPSMWRLRVKNADGKPDHRLMGAAWAALNGGYQGNKYEGPGKQEAIGKLKSLYKSERIMTPNSETAAGHGIPVLLQDLGAAVATPAGAALHRADAQLREIAIAVTGSWVRNDNPFSITANDLAHMCSNFEKRKNDQVVIDYEHASEMPEVSKGGPIPAAGWIHALSFSNGRAQQAAPLQALVEWTPQAEEMLRTGQYRFFSPAIDWGATDKETGEPQGATLTSGALTNHPFLEELPPIMLSDGKVIVVGDGPINESSALELLHHEGAKNMKKLLLKPIPEGDEQSGDHAVFEEGNVKPMGFIPHSDLSEYAAKHLGVNPDQEEDTGESDSKGIAEPDEHAKVEAREAYQRCFFLREAVHKGKIDGRRAAELAKTGRITLAEYIRAQEAEKLIESAIAAGKVLPRDRAFFFRDAMDRPREFQEYVRNAAPVVRFGVKGLGSSESLPLDEEIHLGVKQLMNETGLDYAKALKEFLSANPALGEQYRRKHTLPTSLETPVR
ncbi:MAG: phage protease [Terriglobia bacterium]